MHQGQYIPAGVMRHARTTNSTKCAAHPDGLSDVNAILTSNERAYIHS